MRGLSEALAALALLVVAVATAVLVYFWISYSQQEALAGAVARQQELVAGVVKVEAVEAHSGYVTLYVRNIGSPKTVDTVYIYDPKGHLVALAKLPKPVRLKPNTVTRLDVPFTLNRIESYSGPARIVLVTTAGAEYSLEVPSITLEIQANTVAGFVIGHWTPRWRQDPLTIDPGDMHWVYLNLLTGEYHVRYISGHGKIVREASGKTLILVNTSMVDFSRMTWSQRYSIGPAIIFVNPYHAAKNYLVVIRSIYGGGYAFLLRKLVDDPRKVALDELICLDDQWYPGTHAPLGGYATHVLRFTLYTNNTVRLELLHYGGTFLHMFIYNPHNIPPFSQIPEIVREYLENNYTLPETIPVLYVKARNNKLWNPHNATWITGKPVVVYKP